MTRRREGLDRAKQQVAFDVAQAFYQVVLDRRLAAVAEANLALSTARDSQIEEQVRVGTRAPPDLYRQQAQQKADEVVVIDANNRTTTDIAALLNRLRLDATRPYVIVEPDADTARLAPEELRLATTDGASHGRAVPTSPRPRASRPRTSTIVSSRAANCCRS